MKQESSDKPGVIAPPPLIYALAFLASILLNVRKPLPFPPSPFKNIIGAFLISITGAVLFLSLREMRQAGTSVNPEQPTTALIVKGPYQFTRNPIYLSLTLFYTGLATLANTLWALFLLPVVLLIMQRGVIEREERYLEDKFGASYTHYKAQVRRWL